MTTAHVLWPSHFAVELSPMFWVQLLLAEHALVQPVPQVPLHTESLAH